MKKSILLLTSFCLIALGFGAANPQTAKAQSAICKTVDKCMENIQKGTPGPMGPRGPQGKQGLKGDKGDKGDSGPAGSTVVVAPAGGMQNVYFETRREKYWCPKALVDRVDQLGAQSSFSDSDIKWQKTTWDVSDIIRTACYSYKNINPFYCSGIADLPIVYFEGYTSKAERSTASYLISGSARKLVDLQQGFSSPPLSPPNFVEREILRVVSCLRVESLITQPVPSP